MIHVLGVLGCRGQHHEYAQSGSMTAKNFETSKWRVFLEEMEIISAERKCI